MATKLTLFANDDLLEQVLKSFDKTLKSVEDDVMKLQEWMKNQPHLPEVMDSTQLQNFLILNKFSVEKTKQKIDTYYTIKTQICDVYDGINPELRHMKETMDTMYAVLHPQPTKELYRVLFCKIRQKNLIDKLDPCNMLRHLINIQELRLRHDFVPGGLFVVDCSGVNLSLILKCSPTIISKTLQIFERVFSSPMKGIYVLNSPPFLETLLTVVKKIMKPKLFQRIHFCVDANDLKQFFPSDFLPADFGGNGYSLEQLNAMLKEEFRKNLDLYDRLDRLRVNEAVRPEMLRDDEDFGFYGSFKKLDID